MIYYRFCFHLKNVILVSCAYYIRGYYACKNYHHAWIYYIWSVLSNLDFSKIGMHVTFTYSFVMLRRYLHWDSEMCCMHLFAHIFFILNLYCKKKIHLSFIYKYYIPSHKRVNYSIFMFLIKRYISHKYAIYCCFGVFLIKAL